MIEVEKKFSINKRQLEKIEKLAQFISKKTFTDVYFDNSCYDLTKNDIWLRLRGKRFELKFPIRCETSFGTKTVYDELEDEEKIFQKLKLKKLAKSFGANLKKNGYTQFAKIITTRKKFHFEKFTIDVDEMDFGYQLCEIEVMVKNKSQVKKAFDEIEKVSKVFGLNFHKKVRGKLRKYIFKFRKEHYKILVEAGLFKK